MNILVYGAGVLGSLYAARLQESGQNVTLLARGQRLADLRAHGIVLESVLTGKRTITHVHVIETLKPDDAYDLVIVLIRKSQLESVLPALAANQCTPNVLFMVNNATGPGEIIDMMGRERVMLGFPSAAGTREGYVVQHLSAAGLIQRTLTGLVQKTTIGELDGRITPRLRTIAEVLAQAGFAVAMSSAMDAWLKTHVAVVSPIANALYLAAGDTYRLARTRDGVVLMLRAIREGYQVLEALNIPITPPRLKLLAWIPEPVLVPILQRVLDTTYADFGAARHSRAARDEMQQLAEEFAALAQSSGIATPAMDQLRRYCDSTIAPVADGESGIPLRMSRAEIAGVILVGVVFGGIVVHRTCQRFPRR